jgi:hypothetical protein
MNARHLVDLPDDEYRGHWLAFHENVDWSAHTDVTAVPITFTGPDALYRQNKGSFMDGLEPKVHCRPLAAHARRAKRTGSWIAQDKIFELSLVPALDLSRTYERKPDLARIVRGYLHRCATVFPVHVPVGTSRTGLVKR